MQIESAKAADKDFNRFIKAK